MTLQGVLKLPLGFLEANLQWMYTEEKAYLKLQFPSEVWQSTLPHFILLLIFSTSGRHWLAFAKAKETCMHDKQDFCQCINFPSSFL